MKYAEAEARLRGVGSTCDCPHPTQQKPEVENQFQIQSRQMNSMLSELEKIVIELEKSFSGVIRERANPPPDSPGEPVENLVPVAEIVRVWTGRVENSVRNLHSLRERVEV